MPPDKDKCAREKIATLPLYHLITSDQDKCLPGQDESCRKIGEAQNDYFEFLSNSKKEWFLLSCTREWVDDVDDQCDVLLSGKILIHRVASPTQTFHQANKAVDNKPCPVLIWSSSS